jgi:hypothetical protein
MGGLAPIKVYLYEEDGSFSREFDSISEFTEAFNLSKNIFSTDYLDDIYDFVDGRIACTRRIGREGIRKYKEYKYNRFVGQGSKIAKAVYESTNKGEVVIYDLDNIEIARFKSIFHALQLTNLSEKSFIALEVGKRIKNREGLYIELLPLNNE